MLRTFFRPLSCLTWTGCANQIFQSNTALSFRMRDQDYLRCARTFRSVLVMLGWRLPFGRYAFIVINFYTIYTQSLVLEQLNVDISKFMIVIRRKIDNAWHIILTSETFFLSRTMQAVWICRPHRFRPLPCLWRRWMNLSDIGSYNDDIVMRLFHRSIVLLQSRTQWYLYKFLNFYHSLAHLITLTDTPHSSLW